MIGLAPPFVLLEDRLSGAGGRLFREPVEVVRCQRAGDIRPALARLEAAAAGGLHAAGFLTYEAAGAFEPRLAGRAAEAGAALLWFGLFERAEAIAPEALDAALGALPPPPPLRDLAPAHDLATHTAKVQRALEYIAAGDAYQVNLTFPLAFRYDGDPLALYAALRAAQPAAYGGIVATGEQTILSVSPELFVEVLDGRIVTRPMKGTSPRGPDPAADAAAALTLAADPKQRAENLMIVDLLRNDLSRIARPGSVEVEALCTVETYPTFHTMTSTIAAETDAGAGEVFAALFPCGSVVGAPKIRAAEIIAELEGGPRGVYTGAIGELAPGGDLRFNVAIRTAVLDPDGRGRFGVGGGVVADSDPAAEYREALLKARVLTDLAEDYQLIETLRWTAHGFLRLDRHLDRLQASAVALGFVFDRAAVAGALRKAAQALAADQRVRAALARNGALEITAAPIGPPETGLRVAVGAVRLDAADPFLRHKTSRRATYEQAFAQAAAAGLDEALLLNGAGRIADAARNTVFLERDGRLLTPPVADGALPGVLRAELIAQGGA
ncbi:MAG: aminodeoxychorismate synthase component I, partial [Phenylobacterium sp.]